RAGFFGRHRLVDRASQLAKQLSPILWRSVAERLSPRFAIADLALVEVAQFAVLLAHHGVGEVPKHSPRQRARPFRRKCRGNKASKESSAGGEHQSGSYRQRLVIVEVAKL